MICRLGALQVSDGRSRARDSYYLSLAGFSIVRAQIEQNRRGTRSSAAVSWHSSIACTNRASHAARTALCWALLGLGIRRTRFSPKPAFPNWSLIGAAVANTSEMHNIMSGTSLRLLAFLSLGFNLSVLQFPLGYDRNRGLCHRDEDGSRGLWMKKANNN